MSKELDHFSLKPLFSFQDYKILALWYEMHLPVSDLTDREDTFLIFHNKNVGDTVITSILTPPPFFEAL